MRPRQINTVNRLNKMTTQKHCLRILIILIAALAGLLAAKANALVVLQYHHIADDTPPATSTPPAKFAEHLAYLKKEGFKVIDLQTAISAINNQELPLPKTVLITFDDGSSTIHDTALPLLKKYDYPFVVFINTDAVEQKFSHTLTWPQIKELKKHGAAIANHSASHTHMVRKLPNESNQLGLRECAVKLRKRKSWLNSILVMITRYSPTPLVNTTTRSKNY